MPVLLLLPALVIIVGLIGYPLVRTVYLSFTDTGLGELIYGGSTWVGLDNFKEVFTDEHLRIVADQHRRLRDDVRDRDDGVRVRHRAAAQSAPARQLVLRDRRAAAVGGAGDRGERHLQVAVRLALRVRQLGAGGARLRLLHGLRVVRRALQRVRGDLHHRRLAVVPVHRALAAGGPADDPQGAAARGRGRRCRPDGAVPAGDAAAAAADRRRAGRVLHDLGLQDLRPDLRDGRRRARPGRGHRRGRGLPRGLRAQPLRPRLAPSPSCCS